MGGTTAKIGIPYPVGTDRVMDGDNVMQALAEKVDGAVLFRLGGATGTVVQCDNLVVQTDASAFFGVFYPVAFSAPPIVFLQSGDSNAGVVFELSADGGWTNNTRFTAHVKSIASGAWMPNGFFRVCWLAIGPK